jgi:hypothetical protein
MSDVVHAPPPIVRSIDGDGAEVLAADVCVYGGTAGGLAAAFAASEGGRSVVVVEPSRWLGGMTGGGIGTTDFGRFPDSVGGLARSFFEGAGQIGQQRRHRRRFASMVAERGITVLFEHRLADARLVSGRIASIDLEHAPPAADGCPAAFAAPGGAPVRVRATVFIDAGYEGDLMARAGVRHVVGRESASAYSETYGGIRPPRIVPIDPYVIPGDAASGLLPGLRPDAGGAVGDADGSTMSYNFRMQFSPDPNGRVPFDRPEGYDPARYELVARAYALPGAAIKPAYQFYNRHEANDDRTVPLSIGIVGDHAGYPDGSYAERSRIWAAAAAHTRGLLHFLRTDLRVPAEVRAEMEGLGYWRDEFPDTGGWPHQLYVRTARRMLADYVVTQHDLENRTRVTDGIGLGNYFIDVYYCRRYPSQGGVAIEGDIIHQIGGPYPIPYRAIVPARGSCPNLIVPVCCSTSHIACSSVRMEPIYMVLGEAAGVAASQAIAGGVDVQEVDVAKLQGELRRRGQVLEYAGKEQAAGR